MRCQAPDPDPMALDGDGAVYSFLFINDNGLDADTAFATFFRRGDVRGSAADCAALTVVDAANAARRNLWLAWSDHRFALMQAAGSAAPMLLRQEEGRDRPTLKADKRPESAGEFVLKWRDGSSIELHVDHRERRRFAQFDGCQ
jgi:hypothetical protein